MSEANNTDELIEKAAQGDESAMAELFLRHRERLKRLVLFRMHDRLKSRLDASDVLQEAFIEAARRLPEYSRDRQVPIFLWLRRLTGERLKHLQRMHLGAEKRTVFRELAMDGSFEQDASVMGLASRLAGQFTSVHRNLLREEVQLKLIEALNQMDPDDCDIIAMRHFEELSTEEVSQVLGITRSGVLKRYTRALRKLRSSVVGDSDLHESGNQ